MSVLALTVNYKGVNMIQGYKCNYCDYFDVQASKVKRHENECSNNPKRKTCVTCAHYVNSAFMICEKDVPINVVINWDCPEWEKRV